MEQKCKNCVLHLYTVSLRAFCLTVPTQLNTQKYGLFCSLGGKGRGGEGEGPVEGCFLKAPSLFILISLQYKYSDDKLLTVEAYSLSEIIIFSEVIRAILVEMIRIIFS